MSAPRPVGRPHSLTDPELGTGPPTRNEPALPLQLPPPDAAPQPALPAPAPEPGSAPARRRRLLRYRTGAALVAADLLAGVAAAAVLGALGAGPIVGPFAVTVAATLAALNVLGLYRRRLNLSVLDDVPALGRASLVGVLAGLAVQLVGVGPPPEAANLLQGPALLVSLTLLRGVLYTAARRWRRAGHTHDVGLVIGAGHVGISLLRNLQDRPEYGIRPIGFIDSAPRVASPDDLPAPVLGDYSQLSAVIRRNAVDHVMVAFGSVRETDLVDILRTCDRLECEMSFVPRLFELHHNDRSTEDVWGVPLVRVRRAAFRSVSWRFKRVLDALLSGAALLALAPVLAVCALAVRLEGGPGVLFRQERVGLDGRPFSIVKFRTLKPVDDAEAATMWNISSDPRLGPVGRLLRRTSLDELPQLWIVLTGGMSLVGPRPERPHFVDTFTSYIPRYTARHRVPAGLTGWAQVHGLRGDTSIRDRAAFDNSYIENWSLWGDVKILLRTVGHLARREGG